MHGLLRQRRRHQYGQAEQSSIGAQCVFIVGLSFVSRSISSLWTLRNFDIGLAIFVDLDSPTSLLGDLFGAGFIFWSSLLYGHLVAVYGYQFGISLSALYVLLL